MRPQCVSKTHPTICKHTPTQRGILDKTSPSVAGSENIACLDPHVGDSGWGWPYGWATKSSRWQPIRNVCLFFRTSHSDSSIYIRRHTNRSLESVSTWISSSPAWPLLINSFPPFLLLSPGLWNYWCTTNILLDRRQANWNLVVKRSPIGCAIWAAGVVNKVMIVKPKGLSLP